MNKTKRPKIFITNDDSVYSKGICELVNLARRIGDVVVVAPDDIRSGMSSAITHKEPIKLKLLHDEPGYTVYSCTGTPVDCVKLAFFAVFKDGYPDILLSGINHGSNASVNSVYSATVGAAMEGCIDGIPSIALSLCSHDEEADFSYALPWCERLINLVLKNDVLPKGTYLNVNFPEGEIEKCVFCRQAEARWSEEYDLKTSRYGEHSYLLGGYFDDLEPSSTDTDEWALNHKCASVVPCKVDMTDYQFLNRTKEISL